MDMEVTDWALLLPDLLLDIICRLETTAVIRCACACKPWRRAIIGNASRLRPRSDRFNPNLLLGFFHQSWHDGVAARSPSLPEILSVTAVDTGHSERLSSIIPAASSGDVEVDLSSFPRILSSRDGLLLLILRRRGSKHYELCLCNTMSMDYTFLSLPSIMPSIMEECEYTLLSSYDLSPPGTRHEHGAVRILARAGSFVLCNKDDGSLTYQVFSCGGGGTGIWGPVKRSGEVDKAHRMLTDCRNAVVGPDAVHWLAGPLLISELNITCTVSLDIYTGRAWATELPRQCQLSFLSPRTPQLVLATSHNGRLSLLQPLPDHQIQVWVLDGDDVDAMLWTVQHKISISVQNHPGDAILMSNYCWNVVCPRSGFLLIVMLFSSQLLCINLDSRAHKPVQCISRKGRYDYFPYEMDWSTYFSNMKMF